MIDLIVEVVEVEEVIIIIMVVEVVKEEEYKKSIQVVLNFQVFRC